MLTVLIWLVVIPVAAVGLYCAAILILILSGWVVDDPDDSEGWSAEDEEYFRSGTRYPGQ